MTSPTKRKAEETTKVFIFPGIKISEKEAREIQARIDALDEETTKPKMELDFGCECDGHSDKDIAKAAKFFRSMRGSGFKDAETVCTILVCGCSNDYSEQDEAIE